MAKRKPKSKPKVSKPAPVAPAVPNHASFPLPPIKYDKSALAALSLILLSIVLMLLSYQGSLKEGADYLSYAAPCIASIVAGFGLFVKREGLQPDSYNTRFYFGAVFFLVIGLYCYHIAHPSHSACGGERIQILGAAAIWTIILLSAACLTLLAKTSMLWRSLSADDKFVRFVVIPPVVLAGVSTVVLLIRAIMYC